ncbi:MAG: kynureninase [Candidatus Dormibacteraeota bacterium]|uniref:Kynureninase n=1 Tax=Candidatus Amunia macphersoniae TaxID=3127014 RepID=A0A934NJJ0_9BACT|nr:kynureninase [Candidatus Dormibacteraeota bacterium]
MSGSIGRADCAARDATDPLARVRDRFVIPEGVIYLDGNSLGALPVQTAARVVAAVEAEWGQGLISSWTDAGWMEAPLRVGAKIARLIGAEENEVVVAESTSVCLFKLVSAALTMQPGRSVLLTEEENFHTDLYIAAAAARQCGASIRVVPRQALRDALDGDVAVQLLTHVDYRTGFMHDLAELSAAAHDVGALAVWDLSHSAGAVPLSVTPDGADMATGCGYKYLNGGPGAPAFMYVRSALHTEMRNPLPGWLGHAEPFAFERGYRPAAGMASMLSGTPPILQLAALEAGVDLWNEVSMTAARRKSIALTDLFIALVEDRCADAGFSLASPRDPTRRGSQVSLRHLQGYGIVRALVDRGVIGDFRALDICRFGFAPLYLRYVDVWDAVDRLRAVMHSGAHRDSRFAERAAVT